MCRILLECLAGLLFGFLGFALGMFFGTVIFGHGGFGAALGVIGLAYFLNIAKRIQEKDKKTYRIRAVVFVVTCPHSMDRCKFSIIF